MLRTKIFFWGLALSCALWSCGTATTSEQSDANTTTTVEAAPHGEGKEFTSAYICPMHCKDSGSETAGKCPTCGMDYVTQAAHTEDHHKH